MKRLLCAAISALVLAAFAHRPAAAEEIDTNSRFATRTRRVFYHNNGFLSRPSSFQNRRSPFKNHAARWVDRGRAVADARGRFQSHVTPADRFTSDFSERAQARRLFENRSESRTPTVTGTVNDRFQNMRFMFEDPALGQYNFNP